MCWWVGSVAWKNRSICWNMNTFENKWSIWRNGGLCLSYEGTWRPQQEIHPLFFWGIYSENRDFFFHHFWFGLCHVSEMSAKNVSCKHRCSPDLSIHVTSCYAFGQIFNTYYCIHLTFFSNKMYCQVVIVKWTLHLTHSFLLCSLIPEVTCLHRTFLRAKLDIPEYVPKSFPELQLTWMQ